MYAIINLNSVRRSTTKEESETLTNIIQLVRFAFRQIEANHPIREVAVIVQPETAQIVQPKTGQMPKILKLTTLTNHIEILCRCKSNEERMFYIYSMPVRNI